MQRGIYDGFFTTPHAAPLLAPPRADESTIRAGMPQVLATPAIAEGTSSALRSGAVILVRTRLRPHIAKQLSLFAERQGISEYAAVARLIEQALQRENQPTAAASDAAAGAVLELAALHESMRPLIQRSLEVAVYGYAYSKAAARATNSDRKKLDDQVAAEAGDLIRKYVSSPPTKE